MSYLSEKDLNFLMELVDGEIRRICNEPDNAIVTPGAGFLTPLDHAWLRRFGACWELTEPL